VSDEPRAYWFYAKRYGWGWGLPSSWQGWLVVALYVAALLGGRYVVPPTAFVFPYFVALTAILVCVVAIKGEKPLRWRWGKR